MATLNPHAGVIYAVAFSSDGRSFASGDAEGVITLWHLPTLQPVTTLRGEAPYAGMRIAATSGLYDAQRATLRSLGALDALADQQPAAGNSAQLVVAAPPLAVEQPAQGAQPMTSDLPLQPTLFIGRTAELTEIANLLSDPACHLLTLIGPGGIGKTRLALEVVANHAGAFADGVAFIALASVNTPGQLHLDSNTFLVYPSTSGVRVGRYSIYSTGYP